MKKLNELLKTDSELVIEGLMQDSRDIVPNSIFFAVVGETVDGHDYIDQAIENGAKCIVHSKTIDKKADIVYFYSDDVMRTLNEVVTLYYDKPTEKLQMIGVTGTNGKSTVSYICYELLNRLKRHCGYIGTICVEYNNHREKAKLTTPQIVPLHELLNNMVIDGIDTVCMEVSSQGLVLGRVNAISYDSAIFTNLTHDHLDFHQTMDNYLQAKLLLFKKIKKGGYGIVNIDDEYAAYFINCVDNVLTYSLFDDQADLYAENIKMDFAVTKFDLWYQKQCYHIKTNLLANYNISNLLAAIATALSLNYSILDIVKCVDDFKPVSGRLQVFKEGQPFNVVVDYAHTPDAMGKILSFMRQITPPPQQLIVCFGSAGGRDKAKRPEMGRIADLYADKIILCEDDNRDESPLNIANEIAQGITKHKYTYIENRQEAIRQSLLLAKPLDTICILGKGNDAYMARATMKEYYPGDDNIVAQFLKEGFGN